MKKIIFFVLAAAIILTEGGLAELRAEEVSSTFIKLETVSGTFYLSLELVSELPEGAEVASSSWLIRPEGDEVTLHVINYVEQVGIATFTEKKGVLTCELKYLAFPVEKEPDNPAPIVHLASAAPKKAWKAPRWLGKLKYAPAYSSFRKDAVRLLRKAGLTLGTCVRSSSGGLVSVTARATNGVEVTWTYGGTDHEPLAVTVAVPD